MARTTLWWQRILAWLSLLIIASGSAVISVLGDRLWWTVPILYGPRWVWALPLVGFLPLLWRSLRRGMPIFAVGVILVCGPILDLRIGLGRLTTTPAGRPLRLIEFNAEGNKDAGSAARQAEILADFDPDIVVVAECGTLLQKVLPTAFPDHAIRTSYSLCLVVRGEILRWEPRDPSDFWREYGSGAMVRSDVVLDEDTLRVGLVHLATPRRALARLSDEATVQELRERVTPGSEAESRGALLAVQTSTRTNLDLRRRESLTARDWVSADNRFPLVVAGDFNLPVASGIYREYWGDLTNTWSSLGVGLGHTKRLRLWGIRIDHVLTGSGVAPTQVNLGPPLHSDHLPIIADLRIVR